MNPGRDSQRLTATGKIRTAIKCHWVPHHVDMANALKELEATEGVKITGARYDTVRNDTLMKNVRTGIRTVWVEVDTMQNIPHKLEWQQGGQSGTALVTLFGRPVPCFKCWREGHTRADCTAPRCEICKKIGHGASNCKGRTYASMAQGRKGTETNLDEENMEINPEDLQVSEGMAASAAGDSGETPTSNITSDAREQHVRGPQVDLATDGREMTARQNKAPAIHPRGRQGAARTKQAKRQ